MEKKKRNEIHMGEIIKKILKEKGQSQIWLGGELFANANKIYRILNSASIDCKTVRYASDVLSFDICSYCRELEKKQKEEEK
jgi:hypothetical protein